MSKIKNSTFTEGYVVNKIKHPTKPNDPIDFDKLYYPNGIIPFIALLILLLGGWLTVFIIGWQIDPYFNLKWQNYLIAVPGVTLCLNLLWLLARTGIFNSFGYMGLKFGRMTKFSTFKQKIHVTPINASLNEVKTYQEFTKYVIERQKNTKKFMYISLLIHGIIFLIATIIVIIVSYV